MKMCRLKNCGKMHRRESQWMILLHSSFNIRLKFQTRLNRCRSFPITLCTLNLHRRNRKTKLLWVKHTLSHSRLASTMSCHCHRHASAGGGEGPLRHIQRHVLAGEGRHEGSRTQLLFSSFLDARTLTRVVATAEHALRTGVPALITLLANVLTSVLKTFL